MNKLHHSTFAACCNVIITAGPDTVAPLAGVTICTAPAVGVAEGVATLDAVAVGVGVADGLMNRASTLLVICCAAGLTAPAPSLGPHGLTLLKPNDHWMVPTENTCAPLGA